MLLSFVSRTSSVSPAPLRLASLLHQRRHLHTHTPAASAPVALHCDARAGPSTTSGPPVLFLHGMLGSATNFRSVALALSRARPTLSLDLREHGKSPHTAGASTLEALAGDVAAALEREASGARVDVVGHSLGGKVAMTLALARPDLVRRLVVVDIAPVRYVAAGNAMWAGASGVVRAAAAIDPRACRSRAEVDALLAASVPDAGMRSFVMQNLVPAAGGAGGGYTWRCNLGAILASLPHFAAFDTERGAGGGGGLEAVHVLRGALSPYVRDGHAARIEALFPGARIHTLEGAGHWVHADKPAEFLDIVQQALLGDAAGAAARGAAAADVAAAADGGAELA